MKPNTANMGNGNNKTLLRACECGDSGSILSLLENGANVNYTDSYGNTPLLTAIINHRTHCVDVLLNNFISRANPEKTEKTTKVTPLMMAAGNLEIVKLLINRGCQLNQTNKFKDSALHHAVRIQNPEVVKLLVLCGIDVNITNKYGETAQHIAVGLGNAEICNILLAKQQNFDSFDQTHLTRMLQYAIMVKNREWALTLLRHVTSLDSSLLSMAYDNTDYKLVENLLQNGFDLTLMNPEAITIFFKNETSVIENSARCVNHLFQYGIVQAFSGRHLLTAIRELNGRTYFRLNEGLCKYGFLFMTILYWLYMLNLINNQELRRLSQSPFSSDPLLKLASNPMPLLCITRNVICGSLGPPNQWYSVGLLPLPDKLKSFLRYEDILNAMGVNFQSNL
ncbi:putative ankyrin repeat protein RF_0381 [Patella vulgata]|uniref:putative ankyrin repeat protein RF_0381 n=1 Tax=Patella vulgata TaxID=6465 RepID=UPI00217F39AD|nr:putative ankyrin repeat protein RF_0381 [Patella vulgata]XP_050395133.1 putative ankyrin repeat protein RF_0381 [Patella vulgata]